MKQRVLVCGDRNWKDTETIMKALDEINKADGIELVIEGDANGADRIGALCATVLGIPFRPFPADWRKHGKSAGPIRNRQMLTEGKPTLVLAFHDYIEGSKGTKDMVAAAMKVAVPVKIIHSKERSNGKES